MTTRKKGECFGVLKCRIFGKYYLAAEGIESKIMGAPKVHRGSKIGLASERIISILLPIVHIC